MERRPGRGEQRSGTGPLGGGGKGVTPIHYLPHHPPLPSRPDARGGADPASDTGDADPVGHLRPLQLLPGPAHAGIRQQGLARTDWPGLWLARTQGRAASNDGWPGSAAASRTAGPFPVRSQPSPGNGLCRELPLADRRLGRPGPWPDRSRPGRQPFILPGPAGPSLPRRGPGSAPGPLPHCCMLNLESAGPCSGDSEKVTTRSRDSRILVKFKLQRKINTGSSFKQ